LKEDILKKLIKRKDRKWGLNLLILLGILLSLLKRRIQGIKGLWRINRKR
jgi:hypothetical protein